MHLEDVCSGRVAERQAEQLVNKTSWRQVPVVCRQPGLDLPQPPPLSLLLI